MEWTQEMAVDTDAKVRVELRTSRASLIRFIAEGAWRLLPQGYTTAAKYVQDAAGVKRSEAYRLVATSRAAQMLLARFVQQPDGDLDIKPYRWIVNDIIKSSHTGEFLCSIIHDLIIDIENRISGGADVYAAITDAVNAHPRPAKDEDLPGAPEYDTSDGSTADRTTGSDGRTTATADVGDDEDAGPAFPNVEDLKRAERIIVCPHCHMPLR